MLWHEFKDAAAMLYSSTAAGGTRHTADTMNLRMEINSEIETILAGKRGEWRIMLIVPPGILCYMNMCSSEYMNILYTGLTGRLVMTAALMVYAAAVWTGHKILDIHV